MDVNILIAKLRTATFDGPPTATSLRAAAAIERLAARVDQDQQVILNLQNQINMLLEQLDEQAKTNQTVAETSGTAG